MSNETDAAGGPTRKADALRKAELVRQLVKAGDTARTIIATTFRDSGAGNSTSDILWALATSETPLTLREIAAKLGRDPSTVSLAADKLEVADLVTRRPHPTDGRKRTLVLTEHGLELWDTLRDRLHASNMFAELGADQQLILLELLHRIR